MNRSPALALAALFGIGAANAADAGNRPFRLESTQGMDDIAGDIRAVVDHPFAVAAEALDKPSQWCDILMLHLDTKSCSLESAGEVPVLHVGIVRKYDQPATFFKFLS